MRFGFGFGSRIRKDSDSEKFRFVLPLIYLSHRAHWLYTKRFHSLGIIHDCKNIAWSAWLLNVVALRQKLVTPVSFLKEATKLDQSLIMIKSRSFLLAPICKCCQDTSTALNYCVLRCPETLFICHHHTFFFFQPRASETKICCRPSQFAFLRLFDLKFLDDWYFSLEMPEIFFEGRKLFAYHRLANSHSGWRSQNMLWELQNLNVRFSRSWK